jgi:hypothetical protein
MRPRRWWRERRRRMRRLKAAEANKNQPLREFVYLDEVSVFSLLASRIGALATEFTDSESSSLTAEAKTQAGVSAPVAKAGVSTSVKAATTAGTQVMRKSTVESTFRELYGYVGDSLVMRVDADVSSPPRVSAPSELAALAAKGDEWVIERGSLERGQLLEVEVALDADDSFRASTIFTTLFGFLKEMPQLPPNVDREEFVNAVTGMRLLDGLLAGLVPVRGRVLDYSHVTFDEREFVVNRKVLDQFQDGDVMDRPLYVVGVAEAELFWRDLRRVLFSSSTYRILCRLDRSGVHDSWTPVKLTDVLEGVVPDLRGLVERIPAMLARMGESDSETHPAEQMRRALTIFALDVCDHYAARCLPTPEQAGAYATTTERRAAFRDLADDLGTAFGFEPEPVELTRFRTQAMLDANVLDLRTNDEDGYPELETEPPGEQRFLDCEIIAIYW